MFIHSFNLSEVDFGQYHTDCTEGSFSYIFLEKTQDMFLVQHVTETTRYRGGQEPSKLDLTLTNEEYMVDNLTYLATLGKRDYVGLLWSYTTYKDLNKTSDKVEEKVNFWRGDCGSIATNIEEIDWGSLFEDKCGNECRILLKTHVDRLVEKFVPKIKNKRNKQSKPAWMTKLVRKSVKKKCELWQKYVSTGRNIVHDEYAKQRHSATNVYKRAQASS